MKGFTLGLGWALCTLLLAGCAEQKYPFQLCEARCVDSEEAELTVIDIKTNSDTNSGRPFYMLVRPVDKGVCEDDSYDEVAHKIFHRPVDWQVMLSEVIFPGQEQQFEVRHPKGQGIGVYFLFTDPGKRWKSWVEKPGKQITFYLDANQIDDIL